ncbi:unnamed protein product [Discosporangium mesarthrocarpum]
MVAFSPPKAGLYRHRLVCILNNNNHTTQEVDLFGQGAAPSLSAGGPSFPHQILDGVEDPIKVEGEATVYLKPTCVGIVSSGTINVTNSSRIPVVFHCETPKGAAGILGVEPLAGLLLGKQTSTVTLSFGPRSQKTHRFTLPITVRQHNSQ